MRQRDGLTLVEVLVAVLFLSVGMAAILYALHHAVTALERARTVTWTALAEREAMAGLEFETAAAGALPPGGGAGVYASPDGDCQWRVDLRKAAGSAGARLYRATVTVRFLDRPADRSLVTLVLEPLPEGAP